MDKQSPRRIDHMTRSPLLNQLHEHAKTIFWEAVKAVDAREAVHRNLSIDLERNFLRIGTAPRVQLSKFRRVFVIGAGKAAAPMAAALEEIISPVLTPTGIVNVKYGHTSPRPQYITLNECGHPLPDEAGVAGEAEMERILDQLTETDLLFVLVSGGASSLLPAPSEGISLSEKQHATDLLLKAGADIFELNAVRKHLSALKGGQLAMRARNATLISLILSDVIGDRLDVIGSGLTAPDRSTFLDAIKVIDKYELAGSLSSAVRNRLRDGQEGRIPETPKESAFTGRSVHNILVGSNMLAIQSAAGAARDLGYHTLVLSSTLQGETREVARVHAEILREVIASGNPIQTPACILSGGETTVTVHGRGKGGRNQEFALAAAIEMNGLPRSVVLAAGTDGTDGPTDAAGGSVDGMTYAEALAIGLSPADALKNNDSYRVLDAIGGLVKTGSTGTNVMDLNVMLAVGE
jgi:hydroxypyruvate reductase